MGRPKKFDDEYHRVQREKMRKSREKKKKKEVKKTNGCRVSEEDRPGNERRRPTDLDRTVNRELGGKAGSRQVIG